MSKMKKANRYFRDGLYQEALSLYLVIKNEQPKLSAVVDFNIALCERRMTHLNQSRSLLKSRCLISVIVPTHNVESYIDACLTSIRNQSLKDIEIIVVDDGSTDSTISYIKKHCLEDDRIILIQNAKASGNSGAPRNQAIKRAYGDYIAFVDSDDWIDESMLQELHNKALESRSDIASSSGFYREKNDGSTETVITKYNGFDSINADLRKQLFLSPHFPIVWFRIYKRSFITDNHIRFGETSTSADLPFSFKALFLAGSISVVAGIFYHYRYDRPGSTIDRRRGKGAFDLFVAHKEIISFLDQSMSLDEYAPYAALKALGDYAYNLKFLEEDQKIAFRTEMCEYVALVYSRVKNSEILSANWRHQLNSLMGDFSKRAHLKKTPCSSSKAVSVVNYPRVSVIMPSYNVYQYISKALRSLQLQKLSDIEVLIVDDGSSDSTVDTLEEICKSDNRLHLIRCNKPSGSPGVPRNLALARAKGAYIGFVDSDDWVEPDMFYELYSSAKRHEADVVSAKHFFRHEEDGFKILDINYKTIDFAETDVSGNAFASNYFSNVWNRIYKRELIYANDIYFPRMTFAEDLCFSIATHALSKKTTVVDGGFYHYQYNRPESTTAHRTSVKGLEIIDTIEIMHAYFKSYKIPEFYYKFIVKKQISSLIYTYTRLNDNLKPFFLYKLRRYKNYLNLYLDQSLFNKDERTSLKVLGLGIGVKNDI